MTGKRMQAKTRNDPDREPGSGERVNIFLFAMVVGAILLSGCADGRSAGRFGDRAGRGEAAEVDGLVKQTLNVAGEQRTYYVHEPDGDAPGPLPLVLMFHGGRGDGSSAARMSGFNAVADRHGFIVAYPESIGNWRDGRSTTGAGFEDIEFVRAIIGRLAETGDVDRKRVYSTGISNGGMFTLRLACDAADLIAAFAPVAASMPVPFKPNCKPARPVPLMLIHGRDDGWVPYAGGEVRAGPRSGAGGYVVPVPETLEFWRANNACSAKGQDIETLDPQDDGTSVDVTRYRDCRPGSALTYVQVNGGGHTWPGTPRPPRRIVTRLVGKTSQDISASETIWAFFRDYRLP